MSIKHLLEEFELCMILAIDRPVVSVVLGVALLPVHGTEKNLKTLRSIKEKMSEETKKGHYRNDDQQTYVDFEGLIAPLVHFGLHH